MENTEEKEEVYEYDEAKVFLAEVKEMIHKAIEIDKKVEYKSDDLLILSLKDELHGVFEVYKNTDKVLAPKLFYIGNPKLRNSYLMNLINKEENDVLLKERYT